MLHSPVAAAMLHLPVAATVIVAPIVTAIVGTSIVVLHNLLHILQQHSEHRVQRYNLNFVLPQQQR
jgi:hypothetical protein